MPSRVTLITPLVAVALTLLGCTSVPESTSPYSDYLIARQAQSEGDHALSSQYWERALLADTDNTALKSAALKSHTIGGNLDRAIELAELVNAAGETDSSALLLLGVNAMLQEQYAQARRHFSDIQTDPLDALAANVLTAWAYTLEGNLTAGLAEINKLRELQSFSLYQTYHSGLMMLTTNPKAANSEIEKAYQLAGGGSVRTAQAYSAYLLSQTKVREALKVLQVAREATRDHPVIIRDLAKLRGLIAAEVKSHSTGKDKKNTLSKDSANNIARQVVTDLILGPGGAVSETLYSLAGAITGHRLAERAISYLRIARYADPQQPLTILLQAEIHEALEQYDLASQAYDEIAKLPGMVPTAIERKARALDAGGSTNDALNLLATAIKETPNNGRLYWARGDILRFGKRWDEAANAYTKALSLRKKHNKKDWLLHFSRAIAYERADNWKRAEADALVALKIEPEHPDVLNFLGYSWVDRKVHLRRGLAMLHKATELRPNSGAIVDSLGWAYYRIGRFDQAETQLERAVQLQPNDPVINDHLGDAYWHRGRRREALFQWERALSLEPETPEDVKRIRRKLERARRIIAGLRSQPPLKPWVSALQ